MTDCRFNPDYCDAQASWRVYAAYSTDVALIEEHKPHQAVLHYPEAFALVCTEHLGTTVAGDQRHAGATPAYYVEALDQ